MTEPWKVIICNTRKCLAAAILQNGTVDEGYYIEPDLDTPEVTQFTCPRCGEVETWGPTRRQVAKILWEKSNASRVV